MYGIISYNIYIYTNACANAVLSPIYTSYLFFDNIISVFPYVIRKYYRTQLITV